MRPVGGGSSGASEAVAETSPKGTASRLGYDLLQTLLLQLLCDLLFVFSAFVGSFWCSCLSSLFHCQLIYYLFNYNNHHIQNIETSNLYLKIYEALHLYLNREFPYLLINL